MASDPVLFFDQDVGTTLPKALLTLRLPVPVEYHQEHFAIDALDDDWMPVVGERSWILVGHDSHHHLVAPELDAIRQYGIGCFYLWGAEARTWDKMVCFARAYNRMVDAIRNTPRPFIYRIYKTGRLTAVTLPGE